ncbi:MULTISPECIES: IS3 family transposase [Longicatena]|nr:MULTISPECIES: IS3 family transposase [Longicatena]MBS4976256.1 IS3 family transposase [Eubacterium sp.]RJV72486.1 IS3 family transposase [Eubacterium sp. AM47-9]RJV80116.1 IS3 family transposase [Eubacterium sp. AF19-17]RJV82144.1 IS3 family transposase [Eubacterium sp. AF18-3]RJW00506.1 IS3 family transposase [Eubacterium sp. AM35-6AC]RJW03059.1 IS3 family transposase [Eubacterium sp. AM28-8LB]RJW12523.1 IS3 family transposase [Eubacterium sp. TF12-12]RJW19336.1 IS3 family transposase [
MSKLTREQKIEIYKRRKQGENLKSLSKEYSVLKGNIYYMIKLIDEHGEDILRKDKNRHYSPLLKEEIINKVLHQHHTIMSTAIEYGLSSDGILFNWIKSYKENGYVIVERKKGRPPTMPKKNIVNKDYKDMTPEEKIKYLEDKNLYLEAENEYLKKLRAVIQARKNQQKEKVAVVFELQRKYPIRILLHISRLKRSTYYYTLSKTNKDMKNDKVMNTIIDIYYTHKGRYGYRRITLELINKGFMMNHKKVKRLMSVMGLYGVTPKAKYKSYKGDMNGTVKNQLLTQVIDKENHKTYYERNFETTRCNQKWSTDVSEFHIGAGKLYLSPIIDLHNREIISYSISKSPNFKQTKDMLDQAFDKHLNLNGLIFQSDQGWQYQMEVYHKSLEEKGIIQSMSRKGNCLDNSPMENFFGKMKNEMFYGHEYEYKTLEELELAMEEYITYYNTQRITTKLKGLTPVQYRNQSLLTT